MGGSNYIRDPCNTAIPGVSLPYCFGSSQGLAEMLAFFAIGPIVVPFWGSYVASYKVIPKRNYYGAYG